MYVRCSPLSLCPRCDGIVANNRIPKKKENNFPLPAHKYATRYKYTADRLQAQRACDQRSLWDQVWLQISFLGCLQCLQRIHLYLGGWTVGFPLLLACKQTSGHLATFRSLAGAYFCGYLQGLHFDGLQVQAERVTFRSPGAATLVSIRWARWNFTPT